MEVQSFRPVIGHITDDEPRIRVKNETAWGAQLVIRYEEQAGYKHPVYIQRSVNRHVKRIGLDTYEYRWFERYLDIDQKTQIAEWVAIYAQDGLTAKLVSVGQLRRVVSIKELGKAA